jgi:hypothetical protein
MMAGYMVAASVLLTGCAQQPTLEEFVKREAQCLRHYCESDAIQAENALRDCLKYVQACERAGVTGISYDEVFARLYGRVYLVQRHLGQSREAEETLEKYARFNAAYSREGRELGRPHGDMEKLIEHRYDEGLRKAWKGN